MNLQKWTEPEWFITELSPPLPPELVGVPGIRWSSKAPDAKAVLHRTHLPLIGVKAPHRRWLGTMAIEAMPHQRDFVAFAEQRDGVLCCDPMRSGKTLQTVNAHDPSTGPLVIVGPLSASEAWARWTGGKLVKLEGTTFDRAIVDRAFREEKPVFLHYEILADWVSLVHDEIGLLVCDEAHLLSNRDAARANAAMILSTRARRRICLTGTPLWNTPAGLWAILSICNPGAWGSWYDFARRYGGGEQTQYGFSAKSSSNEKELTARLTEVLIHRGRSKIAGKTVREIVQIPLTAGEKLELEMRATAALFNDEKGKLTIAQIASFRQTLADLKREKATALLKSMPDPKVVWCWHKDLAERVAKDLHAVLITGEMSQVDRGISLDVARKKKCTLVCTMGAASTGIDFSFADTAVFLELDWTPATVSQAEARTYTPARGNRVKYLVCDHAIEVKVIEALIRKLMLAEDTGLPASEEDSVEVLRAALAAARSVS